MKSRVTPMMATSSEPGGRRDETVVKPTGTARARPQVSLEDDAAYTPNGEAAITELAKIEQHGFRMRVLNGMPPVCVASPYRSCECFGRLTGYTGWVTSPQ